MEGLHSLLANRMSWWCSAKWSESSVVIQDLCVNPVQFRNVRIRRIHANQRGWVPPPVGSLNFNIDGAVNGSFGVAGIGGCLRDNRSRGLISFSKSVGVTDATFAKFLAAIEAFKLFRNSRWMNKVNLIIETDSTLITWIGKYNMCGQKLVPKIVKTRFLLVVVY
ncbi:hypothetical protein GQ457_08G028260 [Hibiscus cannabinus]